MRNKLKCILILGLICLIGITANSADKFTLIKNRINSATIVRFGVLITIESKIFDEVDSLTGLILLAKDGRYRAELGDDIYLSDGMTNWEYSAENNQATKRELSDGEIADNRLAFFKDLDSYYSSSIVEKDLIYTLIRLKNSDEALPDSMTVYISNKTMQISKIEYYDLNEDLNSVYITEEFYEDKIEENLFNLNLPDSVEIISLP